MKVWLALLALLFVMAVMGDRYLLTPQEPTLLIDEPDQMATAAAAPGPPAGSIVCVPAIPPRLERFKGVQLV